MEAEREGDDEEDDDDGELEEGDGDVGEHDDVDAEEGQLAHVGQQVQPREQEAVGRTIQWEMLTFGPKAEVKGQQEIVR